MIDKVPATGLVDLPAAGQSWRITYGGHGLTGIVHLPHGSPPAGGWPVVTYGHMTTGGSIESAPSLAAADHPERRRMTQGDGFISAVLAGGAAVLRPDYPGLGSPGPHPYLIGEPLGQSVRDMLTAAARHWPLANEWVSAGHSEGSMAALYAAAAGAPEGFALRGVCAFTPVTRMDQTIGASLRLPVVLPGLAVVTALIALMISGASTIDAQLAELVATDGLSPAAQQCWSHLEQRCLVDLCREDSFGAIAPASLLGVRGAQVRERLLDSLRRQDVAQLRLPARIPIRIDAGRFDEVAPFWLTHRLARGYRQAGVGVELHWWSAMHSPTVDRAADAAARWVLAQLRNS